MKHYPDETAMQKKVEKLNEAFNNNLDVLFEDTQLSIRVSFIQFLFEALVEYNPSSHPGENAPVGAFDEAIEILIDSVKNNGAKHGSFRYSAQDIIKKLEL